jgi:salicylate hydroxylase
MFSDGSTTTADILVGADGVHSATRESMFKFLGDGYEQYIPAVFSGSIAYRGAMPKAKLAEVFPGHRALDHPKIVSLFHGSKVEWR